MTKKRIADLLKEEVEKPAAGEAGPATDGDDTKGTRKRAAASQSTAQKAAATQTPSSKAPAAKAKAPAAKTSAAKSATKSTSDRQLTAKITELEAALAQSAEKVNALQTDVDTHQNRIFELKDSLEKTDGDRQAQTVQITQLTAELDEAKQVILKLTEANQQAKAKAQARAEQEEAAAKPAERQSLKLGRPPYGSYKSIPEYAIQRGTPAGGQNNSMLSDDDIGWVD
ncbi:MAG: hypothetical protein ACR2FS_10210 [Phormidesmis sp.]